MIAPLPQGFIAWFIAWFIAVKRSAVFSHFGGVRQFGQIAIVGRRGGLAVIVFRCRCVGCVVGCRLGLHCFLPEERGDEDHARRMPKPFAPPPRSCEAYPLLNAGHTVRAAAVAVHKVHSRMEASGNNRYCSGCIDASDACSVTFVMKS